MENQQGRDNTANPDSANASSQIPQQNSNAEDFPGYPSYKPEEDITAQGARVSANMEGLSRANSQTEASLNSAADSGGARPGSQAGQPPAAGNSSPKSTTDSEGENPETDVTDDDLMMLDRAERGIDESDDAQAPMRAQLDETDEDGDPLNEAAGREGRLGDDIDVPGSEADDANESIGEEDEENNYYSLGGDDKSGLDDSNEGSINRI